MLKGILNLNNVQTLSKQQQEGIKGAASSNQCCLRDPYTDEIVCEAGHRLSDGRCIWY